MSDQTISSNMIGLLGEIFNAYYTHSDIDRLFAYADAPEQNPGGNKVKKTIEWLRLINKQSSQPLKVLGTLIEEIMEKSPWTKEEYSWHDENEPEWSVNLRRHKEKITQSLLKSNLTYISGGMISDGAVTSVQSLQDQIKSGGLQAISMEMGRALEKVGTDPNAAAHYAGNILEATFKAYLNEKGIFYEERTATLAELWPPVRESIGMNAKDLDSNDLRKIASGLNSVVDGTMYLRNKKSAAHGKTETQVKTELLLPRHARLTVHSAHSLAAYVLECLKQ